MPYTTLTDETVAEYVRERTNVFDGAAKLIGKEFGDGNLNLVFRVSDAADPSKSVIVKQSLPHARIDSSINAPLERATIEAEMLVLHDRYAPGLAPRVHDYNREMYAITMEDLSDHIVLRKGMMQGIVYPKLGEHIGTFLARTLFFTSDLGMDPEEKKVLQKSFVNPELCKITEDLILSNPYFDADNNRIDDAIRARAEENWRDDAYRLEVMILKQKFMTQAQALLHGDLHTGSVFVTQDSTKAFDPEFAFFGPMGFDVGLFIGNTLLNHASQLYHKSDAADRAKYREWLLDVVRVTWETFERQFRELWQNHVTTPMESNPLYLEYYMKELFADSIGFASAAMVRRIVGLAGVEDIRGIPDAAARATIQISALDTARALMMRRREFGAIGDVLDIVREFEQ